MSVDIKDCRIIVKVLDIIIKSENLILAIIVFTIYAQSIE